MICRDEVRRENLFGEDGGTLAAITGGIAEAFYGIPANLREQAEKQFRAGCLSEYPEATAKHDPDLLPIVEAFEQRYGTRNANNE